MAQASPEIYGHPPRCRVDFCFGAKRRIPAVSQVTAVASPLSISPLAARRFMRRALLLDRPAHDIGSALAYHGYVQIDPINVCGRMHDLILRNRVVGYKEGDLMRHLHGSRQVRPAARRTGFEHHLPTANTLVAFPLEAWPHLLASMRARQSRNSSWSGRLSPRQKDLIPRLLAEISTRGPLCSEDFDDSGRARSFWGASSQAKATLQKLFFHGRLLIARRGAGNRRYYDLPERVLPAHVLARPEASRLETARWEALLKLRQRRLTPLKRAELSHVADLVQAVSVAGCPTLYCLNTDLPLLDQPAQDCLSPTHPLLLAPLDPLIYDRRVTAALWAFKYTWEVYTPPAKRQRGYYALPVLAGTELVGHVDPKANRSKGKLEVITRQVRRGHRTAAALGELAAFLGLR
jgi:uncharacterized protein